MDVTLKLFATLSDYLPPEASKNTIPRQVPEGATVRDVLDTLAVPLDRCHLILINGVYTPPARAGEKRLMPGDTVSVWPPVAGG